MVQVKWKACAYDECTWERPSTFRNSFEIERFERFERLPDAKYFTGKVDALMHPKNRGNFVPFDTTSNPIRQVRAGNVLRPYQLEGLNWLAHSWHKGDVLFVSLPKREREGWRVGARHRLVMMHSINI